MPTKEQMATSRTCPKCGHELLIKNGSYGQFIGCSRYPVCRYTSNIDGSQTKTRREVTEWDESGKPTQISNVVQPKLVKRNQCSLCGGAGKTPFKNSKGEVVPDAFEFCECSPCSHPYEGDNYRETRPDDIDYPVSESHYRMLCKYHGWQEPPPYNVERQSDPPEPARKPLAPQTGLDGRLNQLQGQVNFLNNKVTELRAEKKRPPSSETYY